MRPHAAPPAATPELCLLPIPLDQAELTTAYAVHEVTGPDGSGADWPQRLEEIGFLPGERVSVMARGQPGDDPLAVRVGHSTFALRRAEAACVQVLPWIQGEAAR
ncbi:MAG: FeoA family protein [Betaproteobacteria bacterium]